MQRRLRSAFSVADTSVRLRVKLDRGLEGPLLPLTVGEAAAVAGDAAAPAASTRPPVLKAKLRGTTAHTNGAAARPHSGGDGGGGAGGAWRAAATLGRTGRHSCA
jgi:hypothetical protein